MISLNTKDRFVFKEISVILFFFIFLHSIFNI
jgi:hypothetical protein